MESVERGAPGDVGVKTVKRERSGWTVTARVEHGGWHRVPTDHVDSRGADDNGHPAVVRATSPFSRDAGNDSPSIEK